MFRSPGVGSKAGNLDTSDSPGWVWKLPSSGPDCVFLLAHVSRFCVISNDE